MKIIQFVNNRLYGKYFPVKESEEYLKEHYMFFKDMVRHEVSFLESYCHAYEYEQKKGHLKRITTLLGYPKYENMLENERTMKNIEKQLEPSVQQMKDLEIILHKPVPEISIEDINFVYQLRYKRRINELVKLSVAIAIVVICMLAYYNNWI